MIKVKDLEFSYTKEPFFEDINFEVNRGEIFGFLGPSGAGKSTLQKILTGLITSYSGSAIINGVEIKKHKDSFYENIGVDFEFPSLFTLFYMLVLFALPAVAREKAATILIYSDPAAMGLFFMGAIVLLEKSQRVINSIAVSPVKVSEYILAKVISLGVIGTIVGTIISIAAGKDNLIAVMAGTFLGSILFSLIGLMIAASINSLNQFMVATIPFELLCFLPPIAYLFWYKKDYLLLHPGCIVIRMLSEKMSFEPKLFLILAGWIILIYFITFKAVKKMFQSVGGVKL